MRECMHACMYALISCRASSFLWKFRATEGELYGEGRKVCWMMGGEREVGRLRVFMVGGKFVGEDEMMGIVWMVDRKGYYMIFGVQARLISGGG